MSFDILIDFFKKVNYKRILPLLAFPLLFISLSPVRAFAFESIPGDVLENSWKFHNTDFAFYLSLDDTYVFDEYTDEQISSGDSVYSFTFDSDFSNVSRISLNNVSSRLDFEYLPDVYDYYILTNIWSNLPVSTDSSRFTFFPYYGHFYLSTYDVNGNTVSRVNIPNPHYSVTKLSDTLGFSTVAKLPNIGSSLSSVFVGLEWRGDGSVPSKLLFEGLIVALPKSSSDYSGILENIYSELIDQGITLDYIQEFIYYMLFSGLFNPETGEDGSIFGQDTESILGGLVGGNSQLDSYINEYTQVEQSMNDKFFENQNAVQSNFTNWSWGSLATCVDWTSDYLNKIYDNSGDFRTMFMYPILAGIALIFIGRQGMAAYVRSKNNKRGD